MRKNITFRVKPVTVALMRTYRLFGVTGSQPAASHPIRQLAERNSK